MNEPTAYSGRLRWFQVRLKALFALGLLVAVFCGGYAAATRRAEEAVKADREARQKAEEAQEKAEAKFARLNHLLVVVFRHHPGLMETEERMTAREHDAATIEQAAPSRLAQEGGLGRGFNLSIPASDLAEWHDAIEKLLKSGQLHYYDRWGLNHDGYGLVPVR